MNDDGVPSREGGARLRVRRDRRVTRAGMVRAVVFVAAVLAVVTRTAAAVVAGQAAWSPLPPRVVALITLALELVGDPVRALAPLALAVTVSGAVAVWRRSAAVAAFVGTAIVALGAR